MHPSWALRAQTSTRNKSASLAPKSFHYHDNHNNKEGQ